MRTTPINANLHNCVSVLQDQPRIKVEGYNGFWSVIDDHDGYVLVEHNTYGDETCYLVFRAWEFRWKEITLRTGAVEIMPFIDDDVDVYETYDDIITCLEDECII